MFNQKRAVMATQLGHVRLEAAQIAEDHPQARELRAYWESKQSCNGVVTRQAIQPKEILPLLPHLLIAEPWIDGDWRYRLGGTALVARMGVELTGKTVKQIFEPDSAEAICRLYGLTALGERAVSLKGRFLGLGIEHVWGEGMHLPIRGRDGRTHIFGGVFFFD